MTEQREIRTDILLSITTGVLLVKDFSLMHGASEFIMGHPIMLHHFGSEVMCAKLREAVLAQHPDLIPELGKGINSDNWEEKIEALVSRFGQTRIIAKGVGNPDYNPLEGIPANVPLIVISTEKGE